MITGGPEVLYAPANNPPNKPARYAQTGLSRFGIFNPNKAYTAYPAVTIPKKLNDILSSTLDKKYAPKGFRSGPPAPHARWNVHPQTDDNVKSIQFRGQTPPALPVEWQHGSLRCR